MHNNLYVAYAAFGRQTQHTRDVVAHLGTTKLKKSKMKKKLLKALIYCFIIFVQLSCQNTSGNQMQYDYDAIDGTIDSLMIARNIPGFSIALVSDTELIWSKSYGKSDVKRNIDINTDQIMNIGSISKTITAVAIMQLWEKKLVDLNSDVNNYLDFEVRNQHYPDDSITVFQLLTHTSSIKDGESYSQNYDCGDPLVSLEDWIYSNLSKEGELYTEGSNYGKWAPNEKSYYSNLAFGLLGLIIEKVSNQPFNLYCRKQIFKPLGMNNTGWHLNEVDSTDHIRPYGFITDRNRNGYLKRKNLFPYEDSFATGTLVEGCLYGFPNYPDGLARTSVKELSLFMSAIMNGGELNGSRILQKETVRKMLSPQLSKGGSQGLCFYTETVNDSLKLWGHNGIDLGVRTTMYFNPDNKIGIITFQNNATDGAISILKKLYLMHQK
ncbi:serine hydrolase domain-containing protein [Aquimarina algiphila]|uniref:serine hydrolase domain-containing protein n=1 Tax=Aquimarina algiphila TaxID=2047982 RepID=UPI00232EB73A|nr:serine hydrolase domain-containing protein [Aquimarina algiphila]